MVGLVVMGWFLKEVLAGCCWGCFWAKGDGPAGVVEAAKGEGWDCWAKGDGLGAAVLPKGDGLPKEDCWVLLGADGWPNAELCGCVDAWPKGVGVDACPKGVVLDA